MKNPKWLVAALSIYSFMMLGSMATMSIGIGVVLAGILVGFGPREFWTHFRAQFKHPSVRRYLWAAHFLTLACFLSLLFADLFPVRILDKVPEVKWIKDMWKAWYFYWPFILIPALSALSPGERKTVLRSWLISALLFCCVGVFQMFTGIPYTHISTIPGVFHAQAFYGSYLSYASIMTFPVFLGLQGLFNNDLASRKITAPLAALGLFTLVGTFSRTLWLGLPIGLATFFSLRLPRRQAIGVLAALCLGGAIAVNLPFVQARISSPHGLRDRVELWKANWEFFKERPITGIGWHHNGKMAAPYFKKLHPERSRFFIGHAHSNYLEWLGGLGLIGFMAGMYWCFTVAAIALPVSIGLFSAWVVFFINGLTQVNFWESKSLHSMMWAASLSLVFQLTSRTRAKTVGKK